MENYNIENRRQRRVWSGIFLLGIGLVFLLKNMGLEIPDWVFKWHTILLAIGLFIGFRRNFKGSGWFILTLIGAYFTLADITDFNYDFSKFGLAFLFIALGAFLILKPRSSCRDRQRWHQKNDNVDFNQVSGDDLGSKASQAAASDIIDSVNVFSGSNQIIYSKNFKGGDVVAVFGGANINFTQADFDGVITLDVTAIFGGLKLIVPQNWEVKSEITAIFGGVDDKRGMVPVTDGPRKIVKLQGVVMFGGVEIRNF